MQVEEPGDSQAECWAIGDCNYFTWIRLVFCQWRSKEIVWQNVWQ
jgi:hypothetical protein